MATENGPRPAWTDRRRGSGSAGKLRIFVADEEPAILRLLAAILGDRGHEVRASSDPAEVARALEEDAYTLAILEMGIAGGPGLETARRIRARRPEVPIVVMSGALLEEGLDPAAAIPGLVVLRKPFSLGGLDEALRKASGESTIRGDSA